MKKSRKVSNRCSGARSEEDIKRSIFELVREFYKLKFESRPSYTPGNYIPYGGRIFDENEIINLVDASLDFWLTAGKYAAGFEKKLGGFLGVEYCSLTNSGSSANLLAFMALTSSRLGDKRIRKGDEVITVATGFPTTIAPIVQYGAVPVFVDVKIPSCNIDCDKLELALSSRTRAVFLAHTLGNPFDINRVKRFCENHQLFLIEDNCDSLGSMYKYDGEWKHTGSFGHLSTVSFYPPHHMTMGEGGAVCTSLPLLKQIVNSLRDWGRDCICPSGKDDTCRNRFSRQYGELPPGYDHKYVYSHFGYNMKITDLQAAIGCAQIEKLRLFIEKRRKNWQHLRDGLDGLGELFILPEPTLDSLPSWFGFQMIVRKESGFGRNELVRYLEVRQIQTRMLFAGNIVRHPCFEELRKEKRGYRMVGDLSNTDIIMNDLFWLGVYPGITGEMVEYMIESIKDFVRSRKKKCNRSGGI